MPTLEQLIAKYGRTPAPDPEEPLSEAALWRWMAGGELRPFDPPEAPRELTLEWLWRHVIDGLDGAVTPPTADELKAEAEAEDRRFPETPAAMYRRAHSDWLPEKLEWNARYYSRQRWEGVESVLDGGARQTPERLAWLRAREALIRPLIEAAKAEHFRRYPERPRSP
jgi:hypothetical protein